MLISVFFFSSRRRHTRWPRDWSSDVCSSDLAGTVLDGIRMRAVVKNIEHAPQETILEVEWRIDAYDQRDRAGHKRQTVPARTEQLALRVSETTQGWRLRSVETL